MHSELDIGYWNKDLILMLMGLKRFSEMTRGKTVGVAPPR